jgi:hypothetical protein
VYFVVSLLCVFIAPLHSKRAVRWKIPRSAPAVGVSSKRAPASREIPRSAPTQVSKFIRGSALASRNFLEAPPQASRKIPRSAPKQVGKFLEARTSKSEEFSRKRTCKSENSSKRLCQSRKIPRHFNRSENSSRNCPSKLENSSRSAPASRKIPRRGHPKQVI